MGKDPNPKDSTISTWSDNKTTWGPDHWLSHYLWSSNSKTNAKVPVFKKSAPVPVLSLWSCDLYVITGAAWPMLVQWLYIWAFGNGMPPLGTFFLYTFAMQLNAGRMIQGTRKLGRKYGYLDGDEHARDGVPDVGVTKSVLSLLWTTTVRPLFAIIFTYDRSLRPLPTAWLAVELVLYSIVLDFFFYCYHRSCHEIDVLWKYHRTHHLTKHPNPLLSAYADEEQEVLEILLIPLATFLVLKTCGFPMTFYDWWICHSFLIFAEAIGHSGLRMKLSPPGLSHRLLEPFNCHLLGEDHDMHHRRGHRKCFNYGKQTLLWDTIFGTRGPRLEVTPENVDYSQKVKFPLF